MTGTVQWGTLFAQGDWANFESWLRASGGLFYLLVFVLILSILVNFVAFARRLRERSGMKIGLGRILAVLGGCTVLIAAVAVPWAPGAISFNVLDGFALDMAIVYVVGLLWLTLFAIPKRVAAILGFLWGIAAFVLSLQPFGIAATYGMTIEYGVYASILGSLVLMVGSVLAYLEARKLGTPTQMRAAEAAP